VSLLTLAAGAFPSYTARNLSAVGLMDPGFVCWACHHEWGPVYTQPSAPLSRDQRASHGTTCTWPSGGLRIGTKFGPYIDFSPASVHTELCNFYVKLRQLEALIAISLFILLHASKGTSPMTTFCFFILLHATKAIFSTCIHISRQISYTFAYVSYSFIKLG